MDYTSFYAEIRCLLLLRLRQHFDTVKIGWYIVHMTLGTALKQNTSNYHHGNLRQTLLSTATSMIAQKGIESLSLRKLAEQVGVSRTAAYHYFQDKNALLCAIAANGFKRWEISLDQLNANQLPHRDKFEQYILSYIAFATSNPEEYELMFGRCIWKQSKCTEELQNISHKTFQHQVDMIQYWQSFIGLVARWKHRNAITVISPLICSDDGAAAPRPDGARDGSRDPPTGSVDGRACRQTPGIRCLWHVSNRGYRVTVTGNGYTRGR